MTFAADAVAVPGSMRFRKHEHESAHVCVVLDGGFAERDGRSWRDVGPGTVRVSGAARHDIDFASAGATCLVMEADFSTSTPPRPAFIEGDDRLVRLARGIARLSEQRDPISANQTIGTGTVQSGIAAKIGQHKYFFYYEDHNIRPDDKILQDALRSFVAR